MLFFDNQENGELFQGTLSQYQIFLKILFENISAIGNKYTESGLYQHTKQTILMYCNFAKTSYRCNTYIFTCILRDETEKKALLEGPQNKPA